MENQAIIVQVTVKVPNNERFDYDNSGDWDALEEAVKRECSAPLTLGASQVIYSVGVVLPDSSEWRGFVSECKIILPGLPAFEVPLDPKPIWKTFYTIQKGG